MKSIISNRIGKSLTRERAEARKKFAQDIRRDFDRYIVRNLHFKKRVFSDRSEYWFEKSFKFPVFGRLLATIDTERGIMTLEVKSNITIFSGNKDEECAMVDYPVKNAKQVNRILRTYNGIIWGISK